MGLKNRLSLLRQQAGGSPAPQPAAPDGGQPPPTAAGRPAQEAAQPAPGTPGEGVQLLASGDPAPVAPEEMVSLKERLERLSLPANRPPARPAPGNKDADTAHLLGGQCVAAGVIVVDRALPLSSCHGRQSLHEVAVLCQPAFHGQPLDSARVVFMDTETTGLAGGTGTLVFLLGLARIRDGHLQLRQLFLTGYQGEAAMLTLAADWLQDAATTVTFNGKCFDAPLLATRYQLARLKNPFAALDHVDLIYPTRTAFSRIWPDCRLQTAEKRLLDFHREDDLPGAMVPEVWFRFVREGVSRLVPGILEHNRHDLVTLAALMPCLHETFHAPGAWPADLLGIARYYQRLGQEETALTLLRRHEPALTDEGLLELAALYRKRNDWLPAVALWERLAEQGHIEAMERLAKYHEHVSRDLDQALHWATRLVECQRWNADYIQRQARLQRKQAKDA